MLCELVILNAESQSCKVSYELWFIDGDEKFFIPGHYFALCVSSNDGRKFLRTAFTLYYLISSDNNMAL